MNEAAAALTNLASFPSNYGSVENRFANQDDELNAEGYDSEGNLPHFADAEIDDDEEQYWEECIGDWGGGWRGSGSGGIGGGNGAVGCDEIVGCTVEGRAKEEGPGHGRE